jgi:hypothetical protein
MWPRCAASGGGEGRGAIGRDVYRVTMDARSDVSARQLLGNGRYDVKRCRRFITPAPDQTSSHHARSRHIPQRDSIKQEAALVSLWFPCGFLLAPAPTNLPVRIEHRRQASKLIPTVELLPKKGQWLASKFVSRFSWSLARV